VTEGGASADAIAQAFKPIVEKISALPAGAAREDAQDAAKKLEAEARKGEQADESRVQRWSSFWRKPPAMHGRSPSTPSSTLSPE
jgi:hypothetical protein